MNDYGVCILSTVPVRKEPKNNSEQVTQLLFGDYAEITDEYSKSGNDYDKWVKIHTLYDNYHGWIDARNILLINHSDIIPQKYIVKRFITEIHMNSRKMFIPAGCRIPDKIFSFKNCHFNIINSNDITPFKKPNPAYLTDIIDLYMNCPYQWGGKNVFGLDCSGFTQNVFSFFGIQLERDAYLQANQGTQITLSEINTGDLLFFNNSKNKISHVGIATSHNTIVHCSGQVHTDKFDTTGIINSKGQYSHLLCKATRLANIFE